MRGRGRLHVSPRLREGVTSSRPYTPILNPTPQILNHTPQPETRNPEASAAEQGGGLRGGSGGEGRVTTATPAMPRSSRSLPLYPSTPLPLFPSTPLPLYLSLIAVASAFCRGKARYASCVSSGLEIAGQTHQGVPPVYLAPCLRCLTPTPSPRGQPRATALGAAAVAAAATGLLATRSL